MANIKSQTKQYDLEDRTLKFSKQVIGLCRALPFNVVNKRLSDQLMRSATSIGANYREANETDTKKDFKNRIRIAKKEAKETQYWLELLVEPNQDLEERLADLIQESIELVKILAAIYEKSR